MITITHNLTITAGDGQFELIYIDLPVGSEISFSVSKPGLEVVNFSGCHTLGQLKEI